MNSGNRRFSRDEGNGGNATTLTVVERLEGLDPSSLAVLDLSLRWEMDDEQIAVIGQTDASVLDETRAKAVQLVTAGIDVPPAEEVEYVRKALALLYSDGNGNGNDAVETVEPTEPTHEKVDVDELESLLELPAAPDPVTLPEPEPVVEPEPLVEPEPVLEPAPVAEPEPVLEPAPAEPVAAPRPRPKFDVLLFAILALAALVRVWQINKLGVNSDEAVYAGQGAAIANDPALEPFFPAFRAHPLLFQTFLSIGDHLGILETFGRLLSAAIGVATVGLTFLLGKLLSGRPSGLIAALSLPLMPYPVIVPRQILLDGPMVLFATLSLYVLARYAVTRQPQWLYAFGASMGLTAMSKETSLVLLGAVYAFLALTPSLRVKPRQLLGSLATLGGVLLLFPLSLSLAGKTETGGNYLAWQLFRRPNHDFGFYASQVPPAIGFGVLIAAVAGLWLLRHRNTWRETLLIAWIAVPIVFFQLWPVKGFQYLLPIAPVIAVLAGRALGRWGEGR